MNSKKDAKNLRLTIRVTASQENALKSEANKLNMPVSTYVSDKLFNGKERNKYGNREMCKILINTGKYIDEAYNLVEESSTDYIAKSKILPVLENAKGECKKLWDH